MTKLSAFQPTIIPARARVIVLGTGTKGTVVAERRPAVMSEDEVYEPFFGVGNVPVIPDDKIDLSVSHGDAFTDADLLVLPRDQVTVLADQTRYPARPGDEPYDGTDQGRFLDVAYLQHLLALQEGRGHLQ